MIFTYSNIVRTSSREGLPGANPEMEWDGEYLNSNGRHIYLFIYIYIKRERERGRESEREGKKTVKTPQKIITKLKAQLLNIQNN